MRQNLAAYTSTGTLYPEFINISCNDSGEYEITIRERVNLDGKHPAPGCMALITLSQEAMAAFLDELNEKF